MKINRKYLSLPSIYQIYSLILNLHSFIHFLPEMVAQKKIILVSSHIQRKTHEKYAVYLQFDFLVSIEITLISDSPFGK